MLKLIDVNEIEFGLDAFGDIPRDDQGQLLSHARAIRATIAEAVLADQTEVSVIAVGEHHRPEFAISSPETVVADMSTVTENIKLV